MIYPKSIDTDKFIEFLQKLRFKYPFDQIALFMDRLSVHTCRRAKEKMEFLNIRYVYNAAYSPEFNPIEFVFGLVKRNVKTRRLQHFIKNEVEDINKIVSEEFSKIRFEIYKKLI